MRGRSVLGAVRRRGRPCSRASRPSPGENDVCTGFTVAFGEAVEGHRRVPDRRAVLHEHVIDGGAEVLPHEAVRDQAARGLVGPVASILDEVVPAPARERAMPVREFQSTRVLNAL